MNGQRDRASKGRSDPVRDATEIEKSIGSVSRVLEEFKGHVLITAERRNQGMSAELW